MPDHGESTTIALTRGFLARLLPPEEPCGSHTHVFRYGFLSRLSPEDRRRAQGLGEFLYAYALAFEDHRPAPRSALVQDLTALAEDLRYQQGYLDLLRWDYTGMSTPLMALDRYLVALLPVWSGRLDALAVAVEGALSRAV